MEGIGVAQQETCQMRYLDHLSAHGTILPYGTALSKSVTFMKWEYIRKHILCVHVLANYLVCTKTLSISSFQKLHTNGPETFCDRSRHSSQRNQVGTFVTTVGSSCNHLAARDETRSHQILMTLAGKLSHGTTSSPQTTWIIETSDSAPEGKG